MGGANSRRSGGNSPTSTNGCGFDVFLHDASGGAGAGEGGKIDSAGDGDFTGERGGFDASGGGRRGGAGCGGNGSFASRCGGFGFVRCCRGGCRCGRGVGAFAIGEDEGDFVADFDDAAFFDVEFGQFAFVERLHFHRRLVGLDFGQDVADFDVVTGFFAPFDEGALEHGVAQFGHGDDRHGTK